MRKSGMMICAANRSLIQLLVRFATPVFDSFGGDAWKTLEVAGLVVLAALLSFERLLRLAVRIFKIAIDFLRSEQVMWLRRQIRKYRAWKAAEQAVRRAKQSVLSRMGQHIAHSALLYIFFAVLAAQWVVGFGLITINSHQVPQWKVMAGLIGLTLSCAVPAQFLREAGHKERRAARQLWKTLQPRDLKTCAALLMTPLALTALAATVVILRTIGEN